MDAKQREKCIQEIKFLQSVNHPNIVKYLDSFESENKLYIAIEWADKGDLKRYIKKLTQEKDYLDELKVFDYTRQIATALHHMHEKRIIHRDLKPANILVFSGGIIKLGDLGLGRHLSVETLKAFSKVGTPLYMSPELIRNSGYDFKTDVWSLGCVCYELISLKSPFISDSRISLYDLFTKIEKGDYQKLNLDRLSKEIKDLVEGMLNNNPEERISLDEAIKKLNIILDSIENKPKVDPFIVMEDILEKLKLLNYENNYCLKFNKSFITKYTFSCNVYGKPNTPGLLKFNNSNNLNSDNRSLKQFVIFYDLCKWLITIIKNKIDINSLNNEEYNNILNRNMFYNASKRLNIDVYEKELVNELKSVKIKILDSAKLYNGFGEGVCLIVTQLLDKILISYNYIFYKPNLKKLSKDNYNIKINVYNKTLIKKPNTANLNRNKIPVDKNSRLSDNRLKNVLIDVNRDSNLQINDISNESSSKINFLFNVLDKSKFDFNLINNKNQLLSKYSNTINNYIINQDIIKCNKPIKSANSNSTSTTSNYNIYIYIFIILHIIY